MTTTWAILAEDHDYLSASKTVYWQDQVGLAEELVEKNQNLTKEQANVLVGATVGQTPVILTWTDYIETTQAAVVIEYLSTTAAKVRYIGFGHWVPLTAVVGAETFKTVRTV